MVIAAGWRDDLDDGGARAPEVRSAGAGTGTGGCGRADGDGAARAVRVPAAGAVATGKEGA